MVGWNYEKENAKQIFSYNDDLLTDEVENINLAMGTDNKNITSSWNAYQFAGAFFRFNYSYDNRYLFEVNGRYEGSSRFPENHRWAFFPSASMGWRLSEEHFWKVNPNVMSNVKLRGSYGQLGNAAGLNNYQYIQTLLSTKTL